MSTETQQAKPLHVFKEENGEDYYLAHDKVHALELWKADTGMDADEADFTEWSDTTPLTLRNDEGGKDTKTCAEWAMDVGREGAFAGANC